MGTAGTSTAGLIFGGNNHPNVWPSAVQSFNGSAWTNVASQLTGTSGGASGGTQTAAWGAGGGPSTQTVYQKYDGTSWLTAPNLATARNNLAGAGQSTDSLAFAGGPPPGSGIGKVNTEEFTGETSAATASIIDFD